MDDPQAHEEALKEQAKAYKKLQKIADSDEFNDYFDYQIKIIADKMIWTFTTGKTGDNIQNWDDFCKVRGEIIARLQPIQDIYGAENMVKALQQNIDNYYKKQV